MDIEISIKKRYAFIIFTGLLLITGAIYVYATKPNPGHTLTEIEGDIAMKSDLISCVNLRSDVFKKDAVQWCPTTHPKLMHCSIVDDSAEETTLYDLDGTCTTDENQLCSAVGIRAGLGQAEAYLEIVTRNNEREGCWQYDDGHSRNDYKIEVVCCNL